MSLGQVGVCYQFPLQVKAQFNVTALEDFPAKHWLGSLSPDQLFARRIGLERYLHSLCQDRLIGTSDLLKEFLIAIQKVGRLGQQSIGYLRTALY
jgi:hypothetical protein